MKSFRRTVLVSAVTAVAVVAARLVFRSAEGAASPKEALVAFAKAGQACDGSRMKRYELGEKLGPAYASQLFADLVDEWGRVAALAALRFGASSRLARDAYVACGRLVPRVEYFLSTHVDDEGATMQCEDGVPVYFVEDRGWKLDADRNLPWATEENLRPIETSLQKTRSFRERFERGDFATEDLALAGFEEALPDFGTWAWEFRRDPKVNQLGSRTTK